MHNVVNLPPRQRVRYRRFAYQAASGTTGGACGYIVLISFWPDVFRHWLGGLLAAACVLVANSVAAGFYAQKVRLQRAEAQRRREWRSAERARVRAAMNEPTQVIPLLRPRRGTVDRDRVALWGDLMERTGDLGDVGEVGRRTPPRGFRSSGVA